MKITKSQLQKIIKEEMDFMRRRIITGDPVGTQEAIDVRDFLEETHALHFSYKGLNDLEDFLVALEESGHLKRKEHPRNTK